MRLVTLKATEMPVLKVDKILVALKGTVNRNIKLPLLTGIGKVTGSIVSSRCYITLKGTEISALKFDRILVALNTSVDENVISHCRQESSSSEKLREA